MTPERWARIKGVFGRALERPESPHALCGEDAALRQEVERLLATQGSSCVYQNFVILCNQ